MRVESPETGLTDSTGVAEGSTVKRGCLSFALVPALLKSVALLRIDPDETVPSYFGHGAAA